MHKPLFLSNFEDRHPVSDTINSWLMTKGRLLLLLLSVGIYIGCTNPFARKSDTLTPDSILRIDSLLPSELTEPVYTSVDSLRLQLHGPLFEAPDPDDSITLLKIEHNIYAGDTLPCYRYIEHNRAHPVYRWFENDSLKKRLPQSNPQTGTVPPVPGTGSVLSLPAGIDSSAWATYKGFWIPVYRYPEREGYYIDFPNQRTEFWQIADSTYTHFDGSKCERRTMQELKADTSGNFRIRIADEQIDFRLIDERCALYRKTTNNQFPYYVIPAANVRMFDMIRYASPSRHTIEEFEKIREE